MVDFMFNEYMMDSEGILLTPEQHQYVNEAAVAKVLSNHTEEYKHIVEEETRKILKIIEDELNR